MNKYKKYSLSPSISKKTKSNRLIFQIRIEFIKRNKSKLAKTKSRTNSLSTSNVGGMAKAQSATPSDAYSVVSVDSNSISSQPQMQMHKKRKLDKRKRRKKYKRRRKVMNVTDIEEENGKIDAEEKSNIPLSKYETNGSANDQSIQKIESSNAQKHVAPPPIDYAQDQDTSSTHTHSVSHLSEDDNLPMHSVNSSVRIIRRKNGGYKELSHSAHSCSDNLVSSPIERQNDNKNNEKCEKMNDENAQNLDMITPQFPSCSISQPMPIPVVSSSDDENVQKQQLNEESVSRNTQIIRNDKSRKERSNSFSHGPNAIIYGEDNDECRYEEEGSSAFYELSYDRNIKLSRRRAKNNKKMFDSSDYDEFESSKLRKISLCNDDDDDMSQSESNSLSISHESEMQINEKNESEKENMNGVKNQKKSRKSLQIRSNKNKKIPKRVHSQSVDIPKSKYQNEKEQKLEKKQRRKKDKNVKKSLKSSKKRKRAQSVKYKQQKNKINDLSVCKNKVKNSVFRREKGHKKSFDEFDKFELPQRAYSKSVTSQSFDCLMLNDDENEHKKNDDEKKDFSMTHSVTHTSFKKIEEKLKDGLIEPGSTQYFKELDNAMIKLKKKHAKLAKKANKKMKVSSKQQRDRQRSATQKKVKRSVVRSKSVFLDRQKVEKNKNENFKRSKHKKSKTINESLNARKKSKNKKQSEMNMKLKKHKLKKQEKEMIGVKSKKKKKVKKKREYVMDSEDEEDSDLHKRKRIKVAKNDKNKKKKKEHSFHLNSSRREGQIFGRNKLKKNSHSLSKLYDEEIHSNSSFREQRMELI